MSHRTVSDIPDLTGKVIIITGGNSGLGYESAKQLVQHGAEVVIACRDMVKAQEAINKITDHYVQAKISAVKLDLADLSSVRACAETIHERCDHIDVLLNNAGLMSTPYHTTTDWLEQQIGINYLGHFALTWLLWDLLSTTSGARVVMVSSIAHMRAEIDWDNFMYEWWHGYSPMKAYSRSKLCCLLFAYELQRRCHAQCVDCLWVAAHPWLSKTNLEQHLQKNSRYSWLRPLLSMLAQDVSDWALPQIRASVWPTVVWWEYFGPDGWKEVSGHPVRLRSSDDSYDHQLAIRLWEESEKLTWVSFLCK